MMNHAMSRKMERDLGKAFTDWDKNGDGSIQRDEFIQGYRALHEGVNQDVATARALEIFEDSDKNQDGTIDL